MHLQIERRENEGITVLDLKGRVVLGPEDAFLREQVLSLTASGIKNAILNLKDVAHIDTAGIGTLIFCTEKFKGAGGKLVLVSLNADQVSIANALRLETSLILYPNELDAVNSFFPDRAVPHYDILEVVEQIKARKSTDSNPEAKKK